MEKKLKPIAMIASASHMDIVKHLNAAFASHDVLKNYVLSIEAHGLLTFVTLNEVEDSE